MRSKKQRGMNATIQDRRKQELHYGSIPAHSTQQRWYSMSGLMPRGVSNQQAPRGNPATAHAPQTFVMQNYCAE
jgi:hypothetical protein